MNTFTYRYPVTVYFGEKAAEKNLPAELSKVGKNVMLAYGGGSVKRNGVYDELMGLLTAAGKNVTEFTGIMSNPTYDKVQEGARLAANVWGVDPAGKTEAELANAFIDALASFIKEVGLPTTFAEMGIPADTDYKAVADSTVLTGGCCKRFTKDELLAVLHACR